jgi:hypothetical protein
MSEYITEPALSIVLRDLGSLVEDTTNRAFLPETLESQVKYAYIAGMRYAYNDAIIRIQYAYDELRDKKWVDFEDKDV